MAAPVDLGRTDRDVLDDAAWLGDRWVVAFDRGPASGWLATVSLDGKQIAAYSGGGAASGGRHRLAAAGDRVGVVWAATDGTTMDAIYFQGFSRDLKALDDPRMLTTNGDVSQLSLAWNGKRFGVLPGAKVTDVLFLDPSGLLTAQQAVASPQPAILPGQALVGGPDAFVVLSFGACPGAPLGCWSMRKVTEGGDTKDHVEIPTAGSSPDGSPAAGALTFDTDKGQVIAAVAEPDIRLVDQKAKTTPVASYPRTNAVIDALYIGDGTGVVAYGSPDDDTVHVAMLGKTTFTFASKVLLGTERRLRLVAGSDSVGLFVGTAAVDASGATAVQARYLRIKCL